MSVTPEVKSRGMKFAEEQLLKHGWTQGVLPYPPAPYSLLPHASSARGDTSLKRTFRSIRFLTHLD